MNVSGGQTDPTSTAGLILFGCSNVPNERFFLGPANQSTSTDPNMAPLSYLSNLGQFSMENMFNGGAMDVQNNGTANNTLVDSYSRNGLSNQAWTAIPNTGAG
jgi:hypothetical protein